MRRADLWVFTICALIMLGAIACFPLGHPDIPDKAEIEPKRMDMEPKVSPTPTPPERSACEIEVDSLRAYVDYLETSKNELQDQISGQSCDSNEGLDGI